MASRPDHGDPRRADVRSPVDDVVAELARGRSRAIVDHYYFDAKVDGLRHLAPRLTREAAVLEVGCGRGELTQALARAGFRATGIDVDADRLREAEARAAALDEASRPVYVNTDLHELPFPDASFDALISVSVLQYVDWRQVLRECDRVLKPGGRCVFVENLAGSPFARGYRFVRRRFLGYPAHLEPRAHVSWSERGDFGAVFDAVEYRAYNLVTPALLLFFAFGVRLPSTVTRVLVRLFGITNRVDRVLLRLAPALANRAWTIAVLCTKA